MKKKFYSLSALAAALLIFASCNKDPENHTLYLVHPSSTNYYLFADQEEDSVVFETFDSYIIYSMSDWITVTAGDYYDVKYDYRNLYAFTSLLSFEPNTTGKTRTGFVQINSYDYSSAAFFTQLGFMNINHPTYKATETADSVSFDLNVSAVATEDSICFNVSKSWKLDYADNADRTWATVNKTQGVAGNSKVTITLTPNTDTENARTTVFALKCGEVTNYINVNQFPASTPTE